MSWTRIILQLDIDGDHPAALETAADILELVIDQESIVAGSARVEKTHVDECDDDPCTCVLTPRQRRVLQDTLNGHSTLTIARALNLAEPTVRMHLERALAKMAPHITRKDAAA